jgi:hypothetical protein
VIFKIANYKINATSSPTPLVLVKSGKINRQPFSPFSKLSNLPNAGVAKRKAGDEL